MTIRLSAHLKKRQILQESPLTANNAEDVEPLKRDRSAAVKGFLALLGITESMPIAQFNSLAMVTPGSVHGTAPGRLETSFLL